MADLKSLIPILKATILSTSGLVSIDQCNRDFRELQGEYIPYKKLGFKSLEDLFKKIPGFKLIEKNNVFFVDASTPKEVEHISEMIARQKTSTKKFTKKFAHRPPVRRLNYTSSWKPGASSNMWRNKSPTKVPLYDKPKPKIDPPKSETDPKKNQREIDTKKIQNEMDTKKIQREIDTKKSQPTSTLSGLRPGDILARSMSLSSNGQNAPSSKKPSTPVSSYIVDAAKVPAVPVRVSAANRMSALQTTLQQSEPLIQPQKEELKLDQDVKSALLRCCQEMGLPVPIYKTHEIKNRGRGPSSYDCTVKIGMHTHTTYPDSLPSLELAVSTAARKAYCHLQQLIVEDVQPCTNPCLAISRIISLVSSHENGLFANTIPNMYKEQYKEKLPKDWLDLVDNCSQISKEHGLNGLLILLPADPEVAEKSSSQSSVPMLQFPEENIWNIYVMSAHSTVEVWLRIIGENYSELFDAVTAEMEVYFSKNPQPSANIEEGGWYALNSENCWVRARVLELNRQNKTALCFFVDSGDEEEHQWRSLYDLPKQFHTLPPQAILCRLAGLEEYASVGHIGERNLHLAQMVTGKVFVAEVLQTPEDNLAAEDPTITVVLFDTNTDVDVNINKEILIRMSQQAQSPKLLAEYSEVFVTDVTANGRVCVQIHDNNWKLLQQMMNQISSGPFPKEALQASFGPLLPTPSVLYLVKCSSGEWRRAFLRSGISDDNQVFVRYIDYGSTEKVPVKDVLLLRRISEALSEFPAQALYLTLHNISNISPEMMVKFNQLIPNDCPVLCKQVTCDSPIVELYVRTKPHNILCNVNNALKMEQDLLSANVDEKNNTDPMEAFNKKKERLFSSTSANSLRKNSDVPQFTIPQTGSLFNVQVSLSASPWNFVVQPLNLIPELDQMQGELQGACNHLTLEEPKVGNVYAAIHTKDKNWYRVRLQRILNPSMASIYFIDYGDHCMVNFEDLRELPEHFKKLPGLAIKARLHGVSPKNADWSVEDCLRFQSLVANQRFVSVIEKIEQDPIDKGEVLLLLTLVDTSTQVDLYLNVLLAQEGRAVLTR